MNHPENALLLINVLSPPSIYPLQGLRYLFSLNGAFFSPLFTLGCYQRFQSLGLVSAVVINCAVSALRRGVLLVLAS